MSVQYLTHPDSRAESRSSPPQNLTHPVSLAPKRIPQYLVEERVREAVEEAKKAGVPSPGRPTLVERTGGTEHQVRLALAELATAGEEAPPAVSSDSPAVSSVVDFMPASSAPEETAGEVLAEAGEPLADADVNAGEPATSTSPAPASGTRKHRPWPLLLISSAAAVAVWSGWVGLGQLTGFGVVKPLPGIWDDLQINTSVVLPVSVEAYAAYALRCWLGGGSARTTAFAGWSALASLVIGAGAQVAYHLMAAAGLHHAPWQITVLVACVPVVVLGLASALAKLVSSDHQATTSDHQAATRRL